MNLTVRRQLRLMASIGVEPGRLPDIVVHDAVFQPWAERLKSGPISVLRDIADGHTHHIIESEVEAQDEHYGLAIKQYLERHDFDVTIDDPELDQAVLRAVQALPDTFPGKDEVLREVPKLTTLEKTALLERLSTRSPARS